MKTIAVIYYPSIHYTVKELNMALKSKEILENRQLKPCNLWLPFDFHLYQEGLQYFPNQTELTEENISYLAHHQFAWLADYFEYNGIENVKNIIRNKLKINASINNSKIFKEIQKEYGSFSNYIWKFTNNKVIYEVGVTSSKLSDTISEDLKRRGMKFVGTTIIYSYLQAVGIINSHDNECMLYKGKE